MELVRRHVAVAALEEQPYEREALAGGAQPVALEPLERLGEGADAGHAR
jgi:hypothetical protein